MAILSVIVPVYNEVKTISLILQKIKAVSLDKEIIVVDDGSLDGTREILKSISDPQIKIIFHDQNKGKGAALRRAISEASGEIIIFQDADLEYDPNDYYGLVMPILENKADIVFTSRFISDKPRRVLYYWHYLGNKIITNFSNIFNNLNLTDIESGYKVFNRPAIDFIKDKVRSKRFGIEPELTALAAKGKFRIYEVGISYSGRTYAEGKKINWKDGLAAFWHIIRFNT